MKERPSIMRAEEVRAILAGRKTQFRRVVKTQPDAGQFPEETGGLYCPYGQPRDRLWVRECWADVRGMGFEPGLFPLGAAYRADCTSADSLRIAKEYGAIWSPSIHMPRKLSRITLEIASVRVERLQDISEEDAKAEGCPHSDDNPGPMGPTTMIVEASHEFSHMWRSIHGPGSWESNPWVAAISFDVIRANVETVANRPICEAV